MLIGEPGKATDMTNSVSTNSRLLEITYLLNRLIG